MSYIQEVQKGMDLLNNDNKTIFVGQAVEYLGHAITKQVLHYPKEKRIEFPVAEEFQAGFCLGLAIEGYIPICIYPRCNFAILACNQIVNHLDKWELMTGQKLKVLIKMVVGADRPLDPGHQHKMNAAAGFRAMCDSIEIKELTNEEDVLLAYKAFLENNNPMIIIEHGNLYQ